MKVLTLTSTLLAALSLSVMGQSTSELRSQISLKEKQLTEIKAELATLRSKLNAPTGQKYTVKTGDTVSSIARRHKVSALEVMTWNNISDPTKLAIGETLIVSSTSTKKAAPKTPSVTATGKYKVERGDTFYSIARRHKMTVSQLRELNPKVSTHILGLGQSLAVSGKPTTTVKRPAPVAKTTRSRKTTSPKPAPKRTATASISKKKAASAPRKETVAVTKKVEKKPVVKAPAPAPEPESTVSAIILENEITFDAFASKHGTNTDQLNALNGWSLPKATVLARGSEIYVPK